MPSLVDFVKTKIKKRLRRKKAPTAVEDPADAVAPEKNPLELDVPLEEEMAPKRAPLAAPTRGIMKHSGLLSMIRNRGNQQMVDPESDL